MHLSGHRRIGYGRRIGAYGRAILAVSVIAVALASAPAPAAAGLMAAHERYVTGSGFQIGLVDAVTGASIPVPAGVNTADDELHPTLTPDGRYLAFMRTRLVPRLNGDIVPPPERSLFVADRQTGTVTPLNQTGAGPVFSSGARLSWGIRPSTNQQQRLDVSRSAPFSNGVLSGASTSIASISPAPSETVHADTGSVAEFDPFTQQTSSQFARYLGFATINATTGAIENAVAHFTTVRVNFQGFNEGQSRTIGSPDAPAGHPDVRPDDHVALHQGAGAAADIQSVTFPANDLAPAPAPITTSEPERMPAWSPDGIRLGFVRTTGGRRKLGVFDATPGIQTIVNPLVDLGPEAPTPQTRAYQDVWGGLSLSEGAPAPAPKITCGSTCLSSLNNSLLGSPITLSPTVSRITTIGIFVVRVRGRRTLLGRRAPRLRVVGRVPLGRARKGRNRLRWNGKVNGRKLRRGTYLLTYRSLKGKRVTNTSGSIRFKVGKTGKIRRVARERVRAPRR